MRRLITAIQREVEQTSATELPGFELLPDIDPEQYPPIGLRKTEDKPSPLASSRKRSRTDHTSPQASKRRLIQGSSTPKHVEDTKVSEDEEMMSYPDTEGHLQPSPSTELKGLNTENIQPSNKVCLQALVKSIIYYGLSMALGLVFVYRRKADERKRQGRNQIKPHVPQRRFLNQAGMLRTSD